MTEEHTQYGIPAEVIESARKDPQVVLRPGMELWAIRCEGRVVGFYSPHECAYGRRIGPIFVLPEFRRRGLVLATYARLRGPLVACVRDDNEPSIRLHERAGFRRWRRYAWGWWWKRED